MQTSVERVDETTVKLSITIETEAVKTAFDAAAGKLAAQVKVPGFRPGRVPRRVLEKRIGTDALRQEAVSESLPEYYTQAVEAESLDVVGPPEFDVDQFDEGAQGTFTATVQVRPEFDVPDYEGLQVAHPEWELTEEDVAAQVDALRERFAELETVERPAEIGDFVTVTVTGEFDGERLDEASGEDLLYRLDDPEESHAELDRNLVGAEAGSTVTFTDTLGDDYDEELRGKEVDFTAEVKEVKHRTLPELDDDFAEMASEFDTADELVATLREQLGAAKRRQARAELRSKIVETVADLVDIPLPDAMVSEEVRFRVNRIGQQAEQHGMTLPQYLQAVGQKSDDLLARMEADARTSVKAQLVVDAVGRLADIQVQPADLEQEIVRQAQRLDRPVEELASFMTHPERIGALVSDAFRRKTIDHLLTQVQVLSGPPEEEADDPSTDEPFSSREVDAIVARAEAEAEAEAGPDETDAEADSDDG